ncbi:MAG: CDP-alcohol phosphatidyltransferase family protein [Actinomycetota bacterium]|nr:CDP-alcohol phosphatidyltransferase family protein [Ilumatobacteraceae bacterium]MDA2959470.1 CDP-alcohol phosphatidyltransferase family protein [Actinomycetota bacterium]MDA3006898.1 CDP-alcohol phosphatidyltransferase family protein [Actinomycetota bacterium]MDA3034124.1 CDP-alcohol phosphatidyltransferase family protein [Actinomycetota bacterium]
MADDDPAAAPMWTRQSLLTVPNLVTALRLCCLPVFVWLLFGPQDRQAAAWLLGILGATDWVDGYLARRLDQTSEFGKVFDPTVDRLLFVVGIVSLIIDGSVPVWFAIAVLAREVVVGITMVVATAVFNMERFDVTWWGKTATFLLMFAFPGFLMAESNIAIADAFGVAAWIMGPPGLVLSWYTAVAYIPLVRDGIRRGRDTSQSARSQA